IRRARRLPGLRQDRAGQDGVETDLRTVLDSKLMGEPDDAPLGGRGGGMRTEAQQGLDGRRADDVAANGSQVGEECAHREIDAGEINGELPRPGSLVEKVRRRWLEREGVVVENIEASVALPHPNRHGAPIVGARDVASNGRRGMAAMAEL